MDEVYMNVSQTDLFSELAAELIGTVKEWDELLGVIMHELCTAPEEFEAIPGTDGWHGVTFAVEPPLTLCFSIHRSPMPAESHVMLEAIFHA